MNTLEKNSILIVDDEDFNLRLLKNILQKDYIVYTADNGKTAVETAAEKLPDLILLDVLMHGMDGYEVLAALRKNENTKEIPVIFITGLDSKEDEEKGLAMEAADYISKPFSVGIVRLRVKNQIQLVNQIRTIEKLSLLDQLTGIPNRRNLDNRIEMEWGRAIREQLSLSVMMMDIDKFKIFNDTYGHAIGDQVLKIVAGSFKQFLKRSVDFAARYGGEEFSILLPDSSLEAAMHIAEEIRAGVEQLVIPCGDGKTTKVTISIGVHSLIPSKNDTIADLFGKADQALYTAKETGRNKVCCYSGEINIDTQSKKPQTKETAVEQDKTGKTNETEVSGIHKNILEALQKIDGFNIYAGMSHYQGMTDLYCETVNSFTQKIHQYCESMQNYFTAGDMKSFCIAVHSIKSALAAVGATVLSAAAAKLEGASKENDADFLQSEYPAFYNNLLKLHEQLAAVFPKDGSYENQKEKGSDSVLRENVQKALAAAKSFDSDSAIAAVNATLQYDFDEEKNALLKAALDALNEFNFDSAVENLEKINF